MASKPIESASDLSETARLSKGLCNTVKCQLCDAVGQPNWLYKTARPELDLIVAESEFIKLPEAELCDAARSPLVDSKGQWALSTGKEAVGLCSKTPIATVQVLCALLRAEDSKAGHLLELVRLQAVTRKDAKNTV